MASATKSKPKSGSRPVPEHRPNNGPTRGRPPLASDDAYATIDYVAGQDNVYMTLDEDRQTAPETTEPTRPGPDSGRGVSRGPDG